MNPHPESVPINELVPVPGTPLEQSGDFDPLEFVRSIAVARLLMPRSHVRSSISIRPRSSRSHPM